MRVCVVGEYYPRRRDPVLGVWAHRQAVAARDTGADVRVIALERPVPTAAALRRAARGHPGDAAGELRAFAGQPRSETRDGIEIEYVRFFSPQRKRSYAGWHRWARRPLERALTRLHQRWPFELVHAHYAHLAGAAAAPWTEERGLPLAVSVHGGDLLAPTLASPDARATVADVLRRAAVTICNSQATAAAAAELTGSDGRMCVVHPPGAEPPSPLPEKRAEPAVATLAHVIPRKRHVDVLEAIARVPGVSWVAIGDGPEVPALRERVAALGVTDRVEWAGELEPEAALHELARCHLMAMPSVDEAFGVSYVEAMACGLPAIGCAGEGGPEEIAAAGPGMVLVPPRDPEALAVVIGGALGDERGLAELSAQAWETATTHFGLKTCGRETVAAYRRALAL
jgi:glycosyltransferase involved in cell wall biosynthesis